ncbi:hypothetical protein LguiA_006089 [Lonicera macranthoides]
MADLPLDILINHIFTILPVKSLLRLRCVCKQWLGLLTHPEFIKMHVKYQLHHNRQKLLLRSTNGLRCFYSIDPRSSSSAMVRRLPNFPLKDLVIVRTLGSCNGVLCMEVTWKSEQRYFMYRRLLFGNPSTGEYKMLPDPIHPTGPYLLFIGFGYDSSSDEYKLVRINHITRNPHVFSLKLNSWRTVLGVSDNYSIKPEQGSYKQNVGFAVDGSIYWLASSINKVVGFDLKDEEFRELPLPRDMRKDVLLMNILGGSVCITEICRNNEVNVWLMSKEEENNKEGYYWMKLMTMTISPRNYLPVEKVHPLYFMKDGKVLCCIRNGNRKFVLVDPKTKKLEGFTIHEITRDSDLIMDATFDDHGTYIESLVSLN